MFGGLAPVLAAEEGVLVALLGDHRAARAITVQGRALAWTLREAAIAGEVIATRHELVRYCRQTMAFQPVETLRAFFLDARRRLIAEEEVARGTMRSLAVEPRQILARALILGASGIVLVHNHPSGDPVPSAADRRFTARLASAARALDVIVHDHLIVARDGHDRVAVIAVAAESDVIAS